MGNQSTGNGTYILQDGTLSVGGTEYIGKSGTGTFIQTGGSNTTPNLKVGAGSSYNISSAYAPASLNVTGTTTNSGTVTITGQPSGSANLGDYKSIGGTLNPDPSTINFTNISLDSGSAILGGAGDVFNITGNLTNDSTSNLNNLSAVTLVFQGDGTHTVDWSGNSTVGTLELVSGASLNLNLSTNLYVETLSLEDGTSQLADLTTSGSGNIYYDANAPGNAYLEGANYTLGNGESLIAETPEPSTYAMLLVGLGLLTFWRLGARRASV